MKAHELEPWTIIEEADGRKWIFDEKTIDELFPHCVDCGESINRGRVLTSNNDGEQEILFLEDELFKEGEFKILAVPYKEKSPL